jgi:ribosome-associated toxin RatA of RatAB toxin-antitoxin module
LKERRKATMTPTSPAKPRISALAAISLLGLATSGGAAASGGLLASPIMTRQVSESGSSIAGGEAEAELSQPLEAILPVLEDYAAYQEFMPNFRRSRVLAQRGPRARVYVEVSAAAGALTLWGQLDLRELVDEDRVARVIEAQLLEGNIDAFRATWRLEPSADGTRTRVAFQIFVDPDLPLPASLISRENERAARRTIEALRSHLERKLP